MSELKTIKLTEDEKTLLQTIYKTRLQLFRGVFILLVVAAFYQSFAIDRRSDRSGEIVLWNKKDDGGNLLGRKGMIVVNNIFLQSIIIFFATVTYYRKVRPYRIDVTNNVKEEVPYTVTMKQYFEETNQYFLSLDDANYMHHEVDRDIYLRCNIGDTLYLYRAPKSKYVFTINARFTLM